MNPPKKKSPMKINTSQLPGKPINPKKYAPLGTPEMHPGIIPPSARMAADATISDTLMYQSQSVFAEGQSFLGFPYLVELTQRAEYYSMVEIFADDMVRKWITIFSNGEEEKAGINDKIKAIEKDFERLDVRDKIRKMYMDDGFFGRGQIYIDTGDTDKLDELRMPLPARKSKIKIGGLKDLIVVEPMWCYPSKYNANDPLKADFFVPSVWYIMGKEVHKDRLLFCVSRDVPDMLKPVYAFAGLSMTQIAKPYVDNWLTTRQAVSDVVKAFSQSGILTDMSDVLNDGSTQALNDRAALFTSYRNNNDMLMLDKETEEYFNIAVPLTNLDKLQAQAQEHMSAVARIPLVKLLGITPSGLNASSDGEIECYRDNIAAAQEKNLTKPLKHILDLVQLNLFGEIDESITFCWNPLEEMNMLELAQTRKIDADTAAVLIGLGAISAEEERERQAHDEEGLYNQLDIDASVEIERPDAEMKRLDSEDKKLDANKSVK
jgi:uncharacterized protein